MTADLRFGVVTADSAPDDYVMVELDGVAVPAWKGPSATFAVGDVAVCVQDGRRIVAIGFGPSQVVEYAIATDVVIFGYMGALLFPSSGWASYGGPTPVGSLAGSNGALFQWQDSDISTGSITWPTSLTVPGAFQAMVVRGSASGGLNRTYANLQAGTYAYSGPAFGSATVSAGPNSLVVSCTGTKSLKDGSSCDGNVLGYAFDSSGFVDMVTISVDQATTSITPSPTIDYTSDYAANNTEQTWVVLDKLPGYDLHAWRIPLGWQYGDPLGSLII